MKSHFKISIILFSASIFLWACGSGLNTVSIDSDKTVKLKKYSLHSPIGDGWEYEPNEGIQGVMFYRPDNGVMQYISNERHGTLITIYRERTQVKTKIIDRAEFISDYLSNEFTITENLSGISFVYKPYTANRDTIIINEKLFYKTNYGSNEEADQGQLYIYLPKSFENNGIFYQFMIEDYDSEDILSSGKDFDQINNVLATFKCDED